MWLLETGKCIRTFKHKKPVTAVALGEDLCFSGCEAGRVKVWNMKTGDLIKVSGLKGFSIFLWILKLQAQKDFQNL